MAPSRSAPVAPVLMEGMLAELFDEAKLKVKVVLQDTLNQCIAKYSEELRSVYAELAQLRQESPREPGVGLTAKAQRSALPRTLLNNLGLPMVPASGGTADMLLGAQPVVAEPPLFESPVEVHNTKASKSVPVIRVKSPSGNIVPVRSHDDEPNVTMTVSALFHSEGTSFEAITVDEFEKQLEKSRSPSPTSTSPRSPKEEVKRPPAARVSVRSQGDIQLFDAEEQAKEQKAEQHMRQRIMARLGNLCHKKHITGTDLFDTVHYNMGLQAYTKEDMQYLVAKLGEAINLKVRYPSVQMSRPGIDFIKQLTKATWTSIPSDFSVDAVHCDWVWPACAGDEESMSAKKSNFSHAVQSARDSFKQESNEPDPRATDEDHSAALVPVKAIVKLFMAPDRQVKEMMGYHIADQVRAIKEIMLTGETNRLLAELTFVRIDDLAGKQPTYERAAVIEAILAVIVLVNGALIGMQTNMEIEHWSGWVYVETMFTLIFSMELGLRIYAFGMADLIFGHDRLWNIFDLVVIGLGITDLCLAYSKASRFISPAMLHFARLTRLARLIRIFRLKFMEDLQLMLRGVLSGVRTLFWAFVLLFFVLYVIGVLATITVGRSETALRDNVQELFTSLPLSMYTAFRCCAGECISNSGVPITPVLAEEFGLPFVVVYLSAYFAVTLGIYNVILAIYVETTMQATKNTQEKNKALQDKESIRIAHITKQLLKIFCAAEHTYSSMATSDRNSFVAADILAGPEVDLFHIDDKLAISKELFHIMVQDKTVQRLMDELNIPPERAALFDNIDADGDGALQVTELVRGLLKVRGELRKSDFVASLLAVRALQDMMRSLGATVRDNHNEAMDALDALGYKAKPP